MNKALQTIRPCKYERHELRQLFGCRLQGVQSLMTQLQTVVNTVGGNGRSGFAIVPDPDSFNIQGGNALLAHDRGVILRKSYKDHSFIKMTGLK